MVFARYVMFSEVYWHHAVRSATAMLQRAFYLLHSELDWTPVSPDRSRIGSPRVTQRRRRAAGGRIARRAVRSTRRLYKRLAQYSYFRGPRHVRAAGPAALSVAGGMRGTSSPSAQCRRWAGSVAPHEVLFDAPPVEREVEFNIDVYFAKEDRYRPLGEVSPVVQTLARRAVRRLRQAGADLRPSARSRPTCATLPVREILEKTLADARAVVN